MDDTALQVDKNCYYHEQEDNSPSIQKFSANEGQENNVIVYSSHEIYNDDALLNGNDIINATINNSENIGSNLQRQEVHDKSTSNCFMQADTNKNNNIFSNCETYDCETQIKNDNGLLAYDLQHNNNQGQYSVFCPSHNIDSDSGFERNNFQKSSSLNNYNADVLNNQHNNFYVLQQDIYNGLSDTFFYPQPNPTVMYNTHDQCCYGYDDNLSKIDNQGYQYYTSMDNIYVNNVHDNIEKNETRFPNSLSSCSNFFDCNNLANKYYNYNNNYSGYIHNYCPSTYFLPSSNQIEELQTIQPLVQYPYSYVDTKQNFNQQCMLPSQYFIPVQSVDYSYYHIPNELQTSPHCLENYNTLSNLENQQSLYKVYDNSTAVPSTYPFPPRYPYIYISDLGLITVLLKNEISVEMTLDRSIRLVNHSRNLVVATNSRGSASCLYHPGVRVCQDGTNTDVEIYGNRKARMKTNFIYFSCEDKAYRFNYEDIEECDEKEILVNLLRDRSVEFILNSEIGDKSKVNLSHKVTRESQCQYFPYGGFALRINGIKVTQTDLGDVIVTSWPKYLKIATENTYLHVETHFSDISVDKNWSVRVSRGAHVLRATSTDFILSNGRLCAGVLNGENVSVYNVSQSEKQGEKSRQWRPNCVKGNKTLHSLNRRTPKESESDFGLLNEYIAVTKTNVEG